ncbi:UNVERIFIED_CONTAM: hypothetical protein Slati_3422800 [Sesamum latifolium]|uniref:Uncharacterized protein n=1 Tax=Sesamum latifolium TaxID=2727402 RepID=A0AAW2UG19_9LAMI
MTDEVMYDLCMKGFMMRYYNWTAHGETQVIEYYDDLLAPVSMETPVAPDTAMHWGDFEQMNWDQKMVYDVVGPHFFSTHPDLEPEVPAVLILSMVVRPTLVCTAIMCQDYRIDFLLKTTLGWSTASSAMTRGTNRPGIETSNARSLCIPYLVTTEDITWHVCHQIQEGSMCHPSDVEAWRHFDRSYPNSAVEPCNVRLPLCTNGFTPHEQYERTYSCWSVILTPYNLPTEMCMKSEYMFLTMVIPGPSNLWTS